MGGEIVSMTSRREFWNYMKIHIPNLVKAFDNMLAKYDGKMELWNRDGEVVKQTHLR